MHHDFTKIVIALMKIKILYKDRLRIIGMQIAAKAKMFQ